MNYQNLKVSSSPMEAFGSQHQDFKRSNVIQSFKVVFAGAEI